MPGAGGFVPVGRVDSFGPGGHFVTVHGRHVALFRLADGFHALDNLCLHQAGPLCEGAIGPGDVVTCPWHGWSYEIRTGRLTQDLRIGVARHETQIVDGELRVRLADIGGSPPSNDVRVAVR